MTEIEIPPNANPDEIAEKGLGMIAVAMFRANKQGGPSAAVEIGEALLSTLSGMTMDFRRAAARQAGK